MIRTWTPESEAPAPRDGPDYRTVKEWFQQCRTLAAAVDAQREKIQRIRDVAGKCTQSLSGLPGGSGGDKVGFAVEQLATEERELRRMETRLCNLRIEATRRACSISSNPECAEAICEFYVNRKTQEQIARTSGVFDRTVIHNRINRGCRMLTEIWGDFDKIEQK